MSAPRLQVKLEMLLVGSGIAVGAAGYSWQTGPSPSSACSAAASASAC